MSLRNATRYVGLYRIGVSPNSRRGLRQQLNGFITQVNDIIKAAAKDLEHMRGIFVDGLEGAYKAHRYCETGHTNQQMVDYEIWFWSMYAHIDTSSEGPGGPKNP